jgi:hypothetical protein
MTTTPNRTGTTSASASASTSATSSNIHHHRRNREDTELPGIAAAATAISADRPPSTTTSTSTTAAVSAPFTTTTPLLLLLDGVLSLDETRIRDAMQEIVYGLHVGIAVGGVSGGSGGGAVASILPPVVSEQQNHPRHHHHHGHSSSHDQSHNLNNPNSPPFQWNIQESSSPGTCTSATSLCNILEALLNQYPTLAQIPSDHDGSLPLHFAASLGIVPVAMSIWQRVRSFIFISFSSNSSWMICTCIYIHM